MSELTIKSSSCCGTIAFVLSDIIKFTRVGCSAYDTLVRWVSHSPYDMEQRLSLERTRNMFIRSS